MSCGVVLLNHGGGGTLSLKDTYLIWLTLNKDCALQLLQCIALQRDCFMTRLERRNGNGKQYQVFCQIAFNLWTYPSYICHLWLCNVIKYAVYTEREALCEVRVNDESSIGSILGHWSSLKQINQQYLLWFLRIVYAVTIHLALLSLMTANKNSNMLT